MSVKHEWRFKNSDPPIIDALMRLASTIESTGGVADEEDGGGVAADPEWLDLRDAYERAVEALDSPDLAVLSRWRKLRIGPPFIQHGRVIRKTQHPPLHNPKPASR